MADITASMEAEEGLTIWTVTGEPTYEEFQSIMQNFYESPTENLLVDLRQGNLNRISTEDIGKIIQLVKNAEDKRSRRRTAIIVSDPYSYGMSRMFEMKVAYYNSKVEVRVFRLLDEGLEWLKL